MRAPPKGVQLPRSNRSTGAAGPRGSEGSPMTAQLLLRVGAGWMVASTAMSLIVGRALRLLDQTPGR
jgi:hypothetical protein